MKVASVLHGWIDKTWNTTDFGAEAGESLATLKIGDFSLDLENRKAYLCGASLELSFAEFDLLRYLITHPRQLVTPRTMLSTSSGSAVCKVEAMRTMLSLRKKLDAVSSTHYLTTEPWLLYRFSTSRRGR